MNKQERIQEIERILKTSILYKKAKKSVVDRDICIKDDATAIEKAIKIDEQAIIDQICNLHYDFIEANMIAKEISKSKDIINISN